MKKIYITLLIALCAIMQVAAQTSITATKSGYINNTSTASETFNEGGVVVKGLTATNSRKGFIEVPVGTAEAASVYLNVYFYKSDLVSGNDIALIFSTKSGTIPSDITFSNQTDLTEILSTTVNSSAYGWITVDITSSYNAAMEASETALMIQMSSTDSESEMLTFYHVNTGTAYKPYISVLEAGDVPCEPEYNTTNCIMTEGEEIVVGETTITESGSYIITGTTECGAEKIDTVNVLFITEGTVETDYTICAGDELPIQIGATEYQTYTEAGTYTDVITSTDGLTTQTTITNVTTSEEPVVTGLEDASFIDNNSATIDAGEGFASYQWYVNGAAIEGETAQTITISAQTAGVIVGENSLYVEVTNEYGCLGSSDTIVITYLSTTAQSYDSAVSVSGFVQVSTTGFTEVGLQVRGSSSYTSYVRIAYIEVAVGTAEASEVLLNLCFTKASSTAIDYPLEFATKSGAIPSDIDYTNQPDGFTVTETTTISGALTDSWISTDITASYNAAVEAGETAMMVRMISDQNSGVLYFYHLGSGYDPYTSNTVLANYTDTPASATEIEATVVDVTLAPNPMKDMLYISSNKTFDSATIYNVVGKCVLATTVKDNSIDMSGLPVGMYIVSLANDAETVTKMVTKK